MTRLNLFVIWLVSTTLPSCQKTSGFEPIADLKDPFHPQFRFALNIERGSDFSSGRIHEIAALFLVQEDGKKYKVNTDLELHNDTFILRPPLALGAGLQFEFQLYNEKDTFFRRFNTPAQQTPTDAVELEALSPELDSIPGNTLLFHFYFKEKMEELPTAFRFVKLIDEKGDTGKFVWREKAGWSDDGKQLTLMIHPGRIKRGIEYAKDYGPVFVPGKKYRLLLSSEFKSKKGQVLKVTEKTYFVTPHDHESPVVLGLRETPAAGGLDQLCLRFSESMDRGTLEPGIRVKDSKGNTIIGKVSRGSMREWLFTPEKPWNNEKYSIELNDYCTDLASNHLNRKFEVKDINEIKHDSKVIISFKPGT